MTDEVFIKAIIQKGKEAKDKVNHSFSDMSLEQLNWKPSPENWSIAQCLDHLIVADSFYFPALKKITEGTYKINNWERYSPFTSLFGRIMKDRLKERVTKKMIAPRVFQPAASEIKMDIIERYHKNLEAFMQYISNCQKIDIDRIIITSPAIKIVTYSLRDAFSFLIQHEHRHINQAIRIKANENFPG
jgi:uncharacterized damage-inducible protein DinB